jgi:hypothetical protein
MPFKAWLVVLGKLILGGIVFEIGVMLGGMAATLLQLHAPTLPAGADMNTVPIYMMLTTPLYALALAVIAIGLSGNWLTRAAVLSAFGWIAYTLNTQLEASIVSQYATGIPFALVLYIFPAILCGATIAFLFRPGEAIPARAAAQAFWAKHSSGGWAWRLLLAAVIFMPIYFIFGLMVIPFTGEYYRQSMFGLAMPTLEQLLPILLVRSVLFMLACLPIFMLWQKSDTSLFWRLGLALFLLVGFNLMLSSTWLPLYVRVPHTLEILADEFVYAGALVLLLGKGEWLARKTQSHMTRRTAH